MFEYIIDTMRADDWERVRAIYIEGINTGHATFEIDAPTFEQWDAKHLCACRLVARHNPQGRVSGWAALSPVSSRCVYAGVAEVSVYIAEAARGHGIGRTLLDALITASEQNDIWTLQSGIFPENRASLELHLRCGFREVGRRERIGELNGVWRDTVLLERRSKISGTD